LKAKNEDEALGAGHTTAAWLCDGDDSMLGDGGDVEIAEGEVRRRVAFDIGSGATKCMVADVDVSEGRIVSVLFGEEIPVPFGVDWKSSSDGELSEAIQAQGLRELNRFARKATSLGATQSAAIATEVFRKAANGPAFLARVRAELGLAVSLLPQRDEARVGYQTAAGLRGGATGGAPLVGWDAGGARFQCTRRGAGGDLLLYLGELGAGVATAACVQEVQVRSSIVALAW
jgi:exopolyphosphatase/guanosine-5'-triphosphate,3'-diphosphate pyrophosphatase